MDLNELELVDLHRQVREYRAELRKLHEILEDLVDPDPCSYDHHDYCQAHSLHSRPCPHERAKAL